MNTDFRHTAQPYSADPAQSDTEGDERHDRSGSNRFRSGGAATGTDRSDEARSHGAATGNDAPPLSPAERALFRELDERGPGGMDHLEQRARGLTSPAEGLVRRGYGRQLRNGRVASVSAVTRAWRRLHGALREQGEIHIRDVARLLEISRGAGTALMEAFVHDGALVERGPTVFALPEESHRSESPRSASAGSGSAPESDA